MNDRQIGRFKFSERMVRQEPEKIAAVFAQLKLVPVRAETLFAEYCIAYTALSERFEEVPEGNLIPEYTIAVELDSVGWPATIIVQKVE